MDVVPVILSGGSGTRLWPSSRAVRPKQFVNIVGDNSLFELTIERLQSVSELEPIVVCNDSHRFLAAELLQQKGISNSTLILEPTGRNTAPAIALAAFSVRESGIKSPMLVCPSDHLIEDPSAFATSLTRAVEQAQKGKLVTFGIQPTAPETGYGYIHARSEGVSNVERFIEKPDGETASSYLNSDEIYYWNSGMFVFTAETFLDELKSHEPELYSAALDAYRRRTTDMDFVRISREVFMRCKSVAVDVAIMEKSSNVVVVPCDGNWSDLGSWASVFNASEKDEHNNVLNADAYVMDSHNCLVHGDHRLVCVLGCENIAVIETADVVTVLNLEKSQDVKKLVDSLKTMDRAEVTDHSRVYRPWGNYESIDTGSRYQVKRLVVAPGAQLSLQKHHHRAEHWVVVRGTAKITKGNEEFMLTENESTYIPLGEMHRLENPGSIDLELIEVQSGSYLGEDDIVRVDDQYGRIRSIETANDKPDNKKVS